jgi:hypothetical protein
MTIHSPTSFNLPINSRINSQFNSRTEMKFGISRGYLRELLIVDLFPGVRLRFGLRSRYPQRAAETDCGLPRHCRRAGEGTGRIATPFGERWPCRSAAFAPVNGAQDVATSQPDLPLLRRSELAVRLTEAGFPISKGRLAQLACWDAGPRIACGAEFPCTPGGTLSRGRGHD